MDRPVGLQGVEAPKISRQLAHECGKAVSPMHRPRLPHGRYPCCPFMLEYKHVQH
jgi:hypothetical protein